MDFSSLNFLNGDGPDDFGNSSNTSAPLSLDLQKGFTLDLAKPNGVALSNVRVSLIWDPVIQGTDVDIDLSAFLLHNGRIQSVNDVIYFKTPKNGPASSYITHSDDSRTGAEASGDDEDEWIQVNLDKVPSDVTSIVFVANIYNYQANNQTFGVVRSLSRITDSSTGKPLADFALSNDYATDSAIVLGAVEKQNGSWVFKTIGEGMMADLNGLLARFQ